MTDAKPKKRTQIWRKMQGVEAYQSCSDAEFLDLSANLSIVITFDDGEQVVLCKYNIGGDTIAYDAFKTPEEALDWLRTKIAEEIATNLKAINDDKSADE